MAALLCRCGHSILQLWFLLFFLAYSQQSEIGCLPYFHTWCGHSANLECMSEMCCMQLAENTGCKNDTKNCHLHTIAQLCRAIPSQLRHVSTIREKNSLNSNISSTCLYNMVNFAPLMAEICWQVCGTRSNFNRFRVLASLLHRRRLAEVSQNLSDVWMFIGLVHYIYICGGSCP